MCNVCCCYSIFLMERCSLEENKSKMLMSLLTIPGICQQPRNYSLHARQEDLLVFAMMAASADYLQGGKC